VLITSRRSAVADVVVTNDLGRVQRLRSRSAPLRAGRFTVGCAVGATTVTIYFTFATGGADVYVPVYGWTSAGLAAIGGCIVGGYYSIHGVPFRPRG
jgi:hypothetical protein